MSDPGLFVDLGLPVPRGRKLRTLQRILAKALLPLLRVQVSFNRAALEQLRSTQSRVDVLEGRVDRAISDLEHHSKVLTRHESFGTSNRTLETRIDLAQQQAFARVTEAAGLLQRQLSDLAMELQDITNASIQAHDRDLLIRAKEAEASVDARIAQVSTQVSMQVSMQKAVTARSIAVTARSIAVTARSVAELRQRFGSLDLMLDGLRSSLPTPTPTAIVPDPRMDSLYVALENTFRGSSELIRERLEIYLPDLANGAEGKPVLDVGCGRGELLELLKEGGVPAYGIEINSTYADAWKSAGLDVRIADVSDHLRELPERSLSAITAIHVAEHLTTEELLAFLDLALRALDSGGMLILETPNPANLIVGADTFYMDPSHRNPIPAELLAFLVRSRGFADAEIRYLKRSQVEPFVQLDGEREWTADLESVQEVLRERLFGPEDYAVVARRM